MKKLGLYELYLFGKRVTALRKLKADMKVADALLDLWNARVAIDEALKEDSIFLPTSRRAANTLLAHINSILPLDLKEIVTMDKNKEVGWQANGITSATESLETVLSNDMPGISAYLVMQKGIYRTEDLIAHADRYFIGDVHRSLPPRAREDVIEAGKCLAYEVPTACAFHMWRAMETVMCEYYKALTSKSVDEADLVKNWDSYIKALNAAKADKKITEFLDHVRKEYRNPQTHPEVTVTLDEAYRLFGAAASSINQMVVAIQELRAPALKALGASLAALSEGESKT